MATRRLPRYGLQHYTRKNLEDAAWQGTHRDFRSDDGTRVVMYRGGLCSLSDLPEEELMDRAASGLHKVLQERARAQDLGLFELNPDRPEDSILWADCEILFRTRAGWCLGYVQPANFDHVELEKASKYAQVVAHLYPQASSRELLALLREGTSYTDWKRLERSGGVVRDEEGNVSVRSDESAWIRYGGRTFRVKEILSPTPEEMLERSLSPDDAYLYLTGVAAGQGGRGLYKREWIVEDRRLLGKVKPRRSR
jgi:hypothetical protein